VAIDTSGNVWHQERTTSGLWTGWAWLAGVKAVDVSISNDSHGNLHVAVVDQGNVLWHRVRAISGSWTQWAVPPGVGAVERVAIAAETSGPNIDGLQVITARGTLAFTGFRNSDGSWRPSQEINEPANVPVTNVAVAVGRDQLGIVVIGTVYGGVNVQTRDRNGNWTQMSETWSDAPGSNSVNLAASVNANGPTVGLYKMY
jgi:hypothetical protein